MKEVYDQRNKSKRERAPTQKVGCEGASGECEAYADQAWQDVQKSLSKFLHLDILLVCHGNLTGR
jgi:hypothetical protein